MYKTIFSFLWVLSLIAFFNACENNNTSKEQNFNQDVQHPILINDAITLKNRLRSLIVFFDDEGSNEIFNELAALDTIKTQDKNSASYKTAISKANRVYTKLLTQKDQCPLLLEDFEHTYYIEPTHGDDTHKGNNTAPLKTLQQAITLGINAYKKFSVVLKGDIEVDKPLSFNKTDFSKFKGKIRIMGENPGVKISPNPAKTKINFFTGNNFFSPEEGFILQLKNLSFENFTDSPIAYISSSYVLIDNCEFKNNSVDGAGSTLDGYEKAKIYIQNSKFASNKSAHLGTIFLHNDCMAHIENTSFVNNTSGIGAIVIHENSNFTVGVGVLFNNNEPAAIGTQNLDPSFDFDVVEMLKDATFTGDRQTKRFNNNGTEKIALP